MRCSECSSVNHASTCSAALRVVSNVAIRCSPFGAKERQRKKPRCRRGFSDPLRKLSIVLPVSASCW